MQNQENEKLERIASMHDTHKDFDGILAYYTGLMIAPKVKGKITLECGCSTGVMTPMLLETVKSLDIVEGSAQYAKVTEEKFPGKLNMYVSLFEDFVPEKQYEAIVFAGVLHHIEKPIEILRIIKKWLTPGGRIYISVPNMTSFHRKLGVVMGLNSSVNDTSERNTFFEQPGRFDMQQLIATIEAAGFKLAHNESFFFKPFPHNIMNELNLSDLMLTGLYEMGRQYPELACQLYLEAEN